MSRFKWSFATPMETGRESRFIPTSNFIKGHDESLTPKLIARYPRWVYVVLFITSLLFLAGIFTTKRTLSHFDFFFMVIFASITFYSSSRLINNPIELIIDEKGIFIKDAGFYSWEVINETLIEIEPGEDTDYYLILKFNQSKSNCKPIRKRITDLNQSQNRIAERIERFKLLFKSK